MKTSPYETLTDVMRANRDSGHYFFTPGAVQFFHSRIESALIRGRYFVTSEQESDGTGFDVRGNPVPASERRYCVRYAEDDGSITTLSDHMAFGSTAEAMEFILEHDQQV